MFRSRRLQSGSTFYSFYRFKARPEITLPDWPRATAYAGWSGAPQPMGKICTLFRRIVGRDVVSEDCMKPERVDGDEVGVDIRVELQTRYDGVQQQQHVIVHQPSTSNSHTGSSTSTTMGLLNVYALLLAPR